MSRMPSRVARLSVSIDSKRALALSGSRSWPDSAAVVSWPSRSCSSPSSSRESRARSSASSSETRSSRSSLSSTVRALSSTLIALRWRTARPTAKTISRIGTASTIGSKPVVASTARTAAESSVARPRLIHACRRSSPTAPR